MIVGEKHRFSKLQKICVEPVGLLYLTTKAWRLKLIMNHHYCGTLWCIVRVGSDNEDKFVWFEVSACINKNTFCTTPLSS